MEAYSVAIGCHLELEICEFELQLVLPRILPLQSRLYGLHEHLLDASALL